MNLVKEGILLADADDLLQHGREQSMYVVFSTVYGNLVYLAYPAHFIKCDASTLLYLLEDIDKLRFSDLEECEITLVPDMPEPRFHHVLGGGSVRGNMWIDNGLHAIGMKEAIEGVLRGEEYLLRVPDLYELEEKAESGSAEAQYFLGCSLWRMKEYDNAKEWFVAAAEQGLLVSQNRLATCPKNSKAEQNHWLSVIAARNESDPIIDSSKLQLARNLEDGKHIGRDYKKAASLYYQLCNTDHKVSASLALGRLYLTGSGVEKNYLSGLTWLMIGLATYAPKTPPFFSASHKEIWQGKRLIKLLTEHLDPIDVARAEEKCNIYMESGRF
jgi:hypothetical protein